MEPASTTAANSGITDFCLSQIAAKKKARRDGATSTESEGLAMNVEVSTLKSAAGLLLLDSSLSPIWFNREAVQILGYPENAESLTNSELLLRETIRSRLLTTSPAGESVFVKELQSGSRHYSCRAFPIDSYAEQLCQPATAVLLERARLGPVPLSEVCQQFRLTEREQEVLVHLLQGIRNKEIADRMNISSNTVRAFLRLIMIKTGVSSRSAIVGKILTTQRSAEFAQAVVIAMRAEYSPDPILARIDASTLATAAASIASTTAPLAGYAGSCSLFTDVISPVGKCVSRLADICVSMKLA
jgi:DNA-binding CsgD family transcriptional regulator